MRRLLYPIIFSILLAGSVWANPYDVFGVGARAIAMSGAFTAVADDGSAAYYNPAGLAQIPRLTVAGGYMYAQPYLRIDGKDNGVDQNKGTYFAFTSSLMLFGHRWTTCVNFFIPDQHVLRFLMLPDTNPRFTLYYNDNHAVAAFVSSGFELFSWWSIGGGINYIGGNQGGVDFQISEQDPSQGSLKSDIDSVIKPLFSMMFKPHESVRIGVTYREMVQVKLDLPNRIIIPEIKLFDRNPLPIIEKTILTLLTTAYSHFSPRQIALGVSWQINDRVLLALDATYYQWSEMRSPTPYTKLTLEGGLGDLFPDTPEMFIEDPKLHDNIVPALGMESKPLISHYLDLFLRAGYAYRPTPVADQPTQMNFVDSNAHIASLGLGLTFKNFSKILTRPFSLDGYFQAHVLEPRMYVKDRLWDPVGDYEIDGEVYSTGLVVTLRF